MLIEIVAKLQALFSPYTYRVWQRNGFAFFKHWKTELWPPMLECLIALGAFGVGLGSLIKGTVDGVPYLYFLAPGLVISSILFTSTIESMMGTFVRMHVERTFEAIIATPVNIDEVVTAEILWSATRAVITSTCVLFVILVFQIHMSVWVVLFPILALITGVMLASMTAAVLSLSSRTSSFSYFVSLGIYPMQLFSGIFFPLSMLPKEFAWVPFMSPIYPAVIIGRNLFNGSPSVMDLVYALWLIILAMVFYIISIILMKKRLIV